MVRKLYFALAAFSVMSMAGCQNEKIEQPEEDGGSPPGIILQE